jgi:dTDP-4-amino-4,6-dideoxygalactose transaminase
MMRTQLPGYSPLTATAIGKAWLSTVTGRSEVHGELLVGNLRASYAAEQALLTSSGTHALQIGISLARAVSRNGPDAPVALPAYSCYDLVTAAVGADAPVVFYDIDPGTLAPEPSSLDLALARKPFALVGANLCGYPLDWDLLRARAEASGAVLIEDAAQGLGSALHDRPGGSLGDLTVLSFSRGKGWTGGGGGALLARGPIVAAVRDAIAEFGERPVPGGRLSGGGSLAQWLLGRPSLYGLPRSIPRLGLGETRYRPPTPATPAALFSRSLAWSTRVPAAREVQARQAKAEELRGMIEEAVPGAAAGRSPSGVPSLPLPLGGGSAGYLRFPLLLSRDATELSGKPRAIRLGIASGYPRPLPDLEAETGLRVEAPAEVPGARILANRLVTLPTHALVRPRDMAQAVLLVSEFEAERA